MPDLLERQRAAATAMEAPPPMSAMEAEPVAEAAPKAEPMDVSEAAASADEDSEQGDGFRTRGLRGDLHELPEPTVAYEDLTVQCAEALRVRGMSQTAVCAALAAVRFGRSC